MPRQYGGGSLTAVLRKDTSGRRGPRPGPEGCGVYREDGHCRWRCCVNRDPIWGLTVGSCLTLGNELSEETHVLTAQETLLGRGARAESSRVREPRRTSLPRGSQSRVLWGVGLVSGLSLVG